MKKSLFLMPLCILGLVITGCNGDNPSTSTVSTSTESSVSTSVEPSNPSIPSTPSISTSTSTSISTSTSTPETVPYTVKVGDNTFKFKECTPISGVKKQYIANLGAVTSGQSVVFYNNGAEFTENFSGRANEGSSYNNVNGNLGSYTIAESSVTTSAYLYEYDGTPEYKNFWITGALNPTHHDEPTPEISYYVTGTIGGNDCWTSKDYKMTANSETTNEYYYQNIPLMEGDEIKVWDGTSYYPSDSSKKYSVTARGFYNVYFNKEGNPLWPTEYDHYLYFEFTGIDSPYGVSIGSTNLSFKTAIADPGVDHQYVAKFTTALTAGDNISFNNSGTPLSVTAKPNVLSETPSYNNVDGNAGAYTLHEVSDPYTEIDVYLFETGGVYTTWVSGATTISRHDEPTYYLKGVIGGTEYWDPTTTEFAFSPLLSTTDEFVIQNVSLNVNDEIKVYGNDNWYPSDSETKYVVNEEGTYDIYFSPNAKTERWTKSGTGGYFDPVIKHDYKVTISNSATEPMVGYTVDFEEVSKEVGEEDVDKKYKAIFDAEHAIGANWDINFLDGDNSLFNVLAKPDVEENYNNVTGNVNFYKIHEVSDPYQEIHVYLYKYSNGSYKTWVTGATTPGTHDTPNFYLRGTIGGENHWSTTYLESNYNFVVNPENPDEYILENIDLSINDEIKVYGTSNLTWYPSGNNYVITTSGTYDIYFRTTPNPSWPEESGHYFYLAEHPAPEATYYYQIDDGDKTTMSKTGEGVETQYEVQELSLTAEQTFKIYADDTVVTSYTFDDNGGIFLSLSEGVATAKVNCNLDIYYKPSESKTYVSTNLSSGVYLVTSGTSYAPITDNRVNDVPTSEELHSDVALSAGVESRFVKVNENGIVSYLNFENLASLPTGLTASNSNVVASEDSTYRFYFKTSTYNYDVYVGEVPAPEPTYYYQIDSLDKVEMSKKGEGTETQYEKTGITLSSGNTLKIYVDETLVTSYTLNDNGNIFLSLSEGVATAKVDCTLNIYYKPSESKTYVTTNLDDGVYLITDSTSYAPISANKKGEIPTSGQIEVDVELAMDSKNKFVFVKDGVVAYCTFSTELASLPEGLDYDADGNLTSENMETYRFYIKSDKCVYVTEVPAPATEKTLYFQDKSWWSNDSASTNYYLFNSSSKESKAVWPGTLMEAVDGKSGYWTVTISAEDMANYDSIIFARTSADGSTYWNAKTQDILISSGGDNNLVVLSDTATWGDPGASYTWSTFEA